MILHVIFARLTSNFKKILKIVLGSTTSMKLQIYPASKPIIGKVQALFTHLKIRSRAMFLIFNLCDIVRG